MCTIVIKMLWHSKFRCILAVLGIGVSFFLSTTQFGLMVGWCNTASAHISHADVDLWVMAPQTPAFDFGTPIPRHRIQQVRNAPGVDWAEGMIMAWNFWQRPDGKHVQVEMIGLDDGGVGGPWDMAVNAVNVVHKQDTAIVDELYLKDLGVRAPGDEVELLGHKAVVGGISRRVRTLTASPFVYTSIKSFGHYDFRYGTEKVTYVLVRCAPGWTPRQVQESIAREVPHIEVLTSDQFAMRTMSYWMLTTGLGITVMVTAFLGLTVGAVIISQTLSAITHDHLPNYATLLALGFSRPLLVGVILGQSLLLAIIGMSLATALFAWAAQWSARTPIPLEMTPGIFASLTAACLLSCLSASLVSARSVFRLDPVSVFRG